MSNISSHLCRTLVVAVAITSASACGEAEDKSKTAENNPVFVIGDDSGSSAGDDVGVESDADAPLTVEPGVVSIAASQAIEVSAGAYESTVVVPVEIANGLEEAIPVGFNLFRLRVDQLERLPSENSVQLPNVCPSDSLLSAGMVLSCAVAFEIPEGSDPTALIFQGPEGPIEAPVSFQQCTRCDGYCVDLQTSDSHCGQCGREVPTGGTCEAGEPKCPEGRYDCKGSCEWTSTACYRYETTRNSCANTCSGMGLRCIPDPIYYYDCVGGSYTEHTELGCDDVPPASWENCTFSAIECRCLP